MPLLQPTCQGAECAIKLRNSSCAPWQASV